MMAAITQMSAWPTGYVVTRTPRHPPPYRSTLLLLFRIYLNIFNKDFIYNSRYCSATHSGWLTPSGGRHQCGWAVAGSSSAFTPSTAAFTTAAVFANSLATFFLKLQIRILDLQTTECPNSKRYALSK